MSVILSLRDREARALAEELANAAVPELAAVASKLARHLNAESSVAIPGQTTIDEFTGGGVGDQAGAAA